MPLDSSIILQGRPPENPLTTLGNFAGIANALTGLQRQKVGLQGEQQALASRNAIGQVIQANTDPTTGATNWNGVLAAAAKIPAAAYGMGELGGTALTQQGQQIGNATSQLQQNNAQLGVLRQASTGLPPNPSAGDVSTMFSVLAKSGAIKPELAASLAGTMPADPTKIQAWIDNDFRIPAMSAEGATAANYGNVSQIDTGPSIQPTAISPVRGTVTPLGAPIAKGLDPAAAAQRIPGPPVTLADGTQAPATISLGVAPKGPLQSGPAYGTEAAAAATAAATSQAEVNAYQGFVNDVAASRARLTNEQQALTALEKSGTGPGTHGLNEIKSFILANSPDVLKPLEAAIGIKAEDIANYDEAGKYMQGIANVQAQRFGQGTDAKLAAAASANASTHISGLAAQQVLKVNIALERAQQAEFAIAQQQGITSKGFPQWHAQWAAAHDPRAFMIDMLSPQERAALNASMKTKSERQAFAEGLRAAKAAGVPGIAEMVP